MKHNRGIVESTVLSLVCTGGSLGCLVTAFQLPVSRPEVIGLAWLFWAIVCALVLRYRHGGWIASAMALGMLVYARMEGTAQRQLLGMLGSIARLYDAGYGWGIPAVLQVELKSADLALCAMGAVLILAVSFAVCRRGGTALAVIALVLPFLSCLVLTDTVPDGPSLFALMLGVILLMLTSDVRLESGDQATRLCIAAAIPTAIALGALFYFVPKANYENKTENLRQELAAYLEELPEKIQTGKITLPDFLREVNQVNLASLSAQPQLHIPVAEVTALKTGDVYLRRQDYDRYTGTSWLSTANRQETLAGIGDETGRVFVRMLNAQNCLLLPCFPDGETILSDGLAENPQNLREYSFACRSGLLGPQPGSAWLELPEQTMQAAKSILADIPGDFSTTGTAAKAIAAYVRSSAVYDRATRAMPAGNSDFAIWFLEDAERGYCVHFATAAAVLLRSAGIPARYVTGYKAECIADTITQVTTNDAHAWVEYYDYSTWTWYVLEATPGELTPTPPETTAPPTTEAATQPVTRPEPTAAPETTPPVTEPVEEPPAAISPALWIPALSAAAVLLLLEAQRILRIRLRRRRQQRGNTNRQAAARWPELQRMFRLLGVKPPEALRQLTEKALFSQHTLSDGELSQFEACAAACRTALRQKSWYRRILFRYWYAVI